MQSLDQPIWHTVLASDPDLFLFLGDAIYGDFDGKQAFTPTEETLLRDWGKLASQPGFEALRKQVPIMATWDNHDYGSHNGGVEFSLKEASRRIFLDYFGEPENSLRRQRDGIYDAKIYGPPGRRVQIILLDNRWNRGALIPDSRSEAERNALGISGSMGHTPNDDPEETLLGEQQWHWLEAQLRKPAQIRLICSGTQIVNDAKGMQEWGNFPRERMRLFDLIKKTWAAGVILLSGNVHYSELSLTSEGPYPLYDFTSSGMTHNSAIYAEYQNPYRVAGPYTENHFSLAEIDWLSADTAVIFKTVDIEEYTKFEYKIQIGALQ